MSGSSASSLLWWLSVVVAVLSACGAVVGWWVFQSSRQRPSPAALRRLFAGRVVWVTGASSGIGRAMAVRLAELGAQLVLSGRDQAALNTVKRLCEAKVATQSSSSSSSSSPAVVVEAFDLGWVGGLNGEAELRQVVERVRRAFDGRLHLLVNCGGLTVRGGVEDTALHVDHQLMNVNFFGAVALTKAALPLLLSTSPPSPSTPLPSVLFVNSVQGLLSLPYRSSYAASKFALTAFAASLRYEMAGRLRVTSMYPGYVQTNLSLNAVQGDGTRWGQMDATTKGGMRPEDVAERCLQAVAVGESDVLMADTRAVVGYHLQYWLPSLLTRVMTQTADKQRAELRKAKGATAAPHSAKGR